MILQFDLILKTSIFPNRKLALVIKFDSLLPVSNETDKIRGLYWLKIFLTERVNFIRANKDACEWEFFLISQNRKTAKSYIKGIKNSNPDKSSRRTPIACLIVWTFHQEIRTSTAMLFPEMWISACSLLSHSFTFHDFPCRIVC